MNKHIIQGNDEVFKKELWRQFIAKLEKDWALKYTQFGDNITNIVTPTNFAQAVRNDMQAYFKLSDSKVKLLNYLTLHNYFQSNGLPPRVKISTLDTFSKYLGYDFWVDFVEKNTHLIEATKEAEQKDAKVSELTIKNTSEEVKTELVSTQSSRRQSDYARTGLSNRMGQQSSNANLFRKVLGLVVVLLMIFSFNKMRNGQFEASNSKVGILTDEKNSVFKKLIRDANELEFSLYEKVPDIEDTTLLNNYFTNDGTAINIIKGVLEKAKRSNRRLRKPPSSYVILNSEVSDDGQYIRIKTEEQWYLMWYDNETKEDVKLYDTLNHHDYLLKMQNGSWKIHVDNYDGRTKKVNN